MTTAMIAAIITMIAMTTMSTMTTATIAAMITMIAITTMTAMTTKMPAMTSMTSMTLVYLLSVLSSACAVNVTVFPAFQHIKFPGTATVGCNFAGPLDACQVRVTEHFNYHSLNGTLDFGLGQQSASGELRNQNGQLRVNASYHGGGLNMGDCGVRLEVTDYLILLVQCQGWARDLGWSQGLALVTAVDANVLPATSPNPRLIVALPGSDVAVLFKASRALSRCTINTPAEGEVNLLRGASLPSDSRYQLHSAGMEQGECGWTLKNVSERDAGVWGWAGQRHEAWAVQATVVVVLATPEGEPTLVISEPSRLRPGSLLSATCRGPPASPPAKLSWWLGDTEVRVGGGNDTRPSALPWQPQPAVQTYTRLLVEEDAGKRLECRLQHPGLDMPGKRVSLELLPAFGE